MTTSEAPASHPVVAVHRPLLGREPLVDAHGEVVAFALVHRGVGAPRLGDADERGVLTVDRLLTTLEVGLDAVVGDKDVWCEVDRNVLQGATPVTLPPARTVLEVHVGDVAIPAAVDGRRRLRGQGYRLALKGLDPEDLDPALLELADVVKLDVRAGWDVVRRLAQACADHGVELVAEGCTSPDDVDAARALGAVLVQGQALPAGLGVRAGTLGASALTQARLAVELLRPDLDVQHVEQILRPEPGLVLQLLHMAGSGAAGGLRRPVRSVRDALVLLGTDRLRQWAALVVLGRQRPAVADALTTALCRARACDLLAQRVGLDPPSAFTAGLLSALDLVLGRPLADLEAELDLDDCLAGAAFHGRGAIGGLVTRCRDAELGRDGAGDVELELVRAMAFCWAAALVSTLEDGQRSAARAG